MTSASMEPCSQRLAFTSSPTTKSSASSSKYIRVKLANVLERILNCLRIRHENEENYTGAKLMKQKFDEFSRAEQQRQE